MFRNEVKLYLSHKFLRFNLKSGDNRVDGARMCHSWYCLYRCLKAPNLTWMREMKLAVVVSNHLTRSPPKYVMPAVAQIIGNTEWLVDYWSMDRAVSRESGKLAKIFQTTSTEGKYLELDIERRRNLTKAAGIGVCSGTITRSLNDCSTLFINTVGDVQLIESLWTISSKR